MNKFGLLFLVPVVLILSPATAQSFQMVNTWSSTYRDHVKVRFCACSWDKDASPSTPSSQMEGVVMDVITTINSGLSTDLNLVYDGKARKTGTSDPATPYDPITNPSCSDEEGYCQDNSTVVVSGRVYIHATTNTGSAPGTLGQANINSSAKYCYSTIAGGVVRLFQYPNANFPGKIDSSATVGTNSYWFPQVLIHELGHVVGWWHDHYSSLSYPWDILEPGWKPPEGRTIWEHDYLTSRASNECGFSPYVGQARQLKHFVSYNEGSSWAEVPDDGNLNATTNAKPGAAWGSTNIGNRYVLAWARPEDGHIVTIIGDGYSWLPNTRIVHTDSESRTRVGVSIAYGNSEWVMVWTGIDESASFYGKPIYYKVSFDGITWSEARLFEFSFTGVTGWGAIQTPVIRFSDYDGGRFVLMFQDWNTEFTYDGTLGSVEDQIYHLDRVRQCVSESPFWYGFGNCTMLGSNQYKAFTWVSPGMDCQRGVNECLVTGVTGSPGSNGLHALWNHTAYFLTTGHFLGDNLGSIYIQSEASASNGWTTRQEVSVLWTGSKWMIAANLDGEMYSGTKSSSTPSQDWGQKTVISTDTAWTAPELVYAEPWWTEVSAFFAVE